MEKKTVLFPIEIKARELKSKILLSLECAKRGMRAYIGSKTAINMLYPKLDSGIYFHKSGDRVERINRIKNHCSHFVIIDEEVGPAIPNDFLYQTLKNRLRPDAIKHIDKIFLIGEKYKNIAKNVYDKSENDLIATGWPRIDLWRKEFLPLHSKETQEIKKKYGDYILLSSNFGVTSKLSLKLWERHVREHKVWGNDYKDYFLKNIYSKYESFLLYGNLIRDICNKREDLKFIIRPHPADDFDGWKKQIENIPNVKLIYEGEISPWIYASTCLLHYGCTSAVQAKMANIPSIVYKKPDGILGDTTAFNISKQFYDTNEFINFIDNINNHLSSKRSKENLEILKSNISSLEGETASSKIANILSNLDTKKINQSSLSLSEKLMLEGKYFGLKGIFIKNKIFGENETSPRSQKIPGGISEFEIKNFAKKVAPFIHLKPNNISCEKTARNLVKIECTKNNND